MGATTPMGAVYDCAQAKQGSTPHARRWEDTRRVACRRHTAGQLGLGWRGAASARAQPAEFVKLDAARAVGIELGEDAPRLARGRLETEHVQRHVELGLVDVDSGLSCRACPCSQGLVYLRLHM